MAAQASKIGRLSEEGEHFPLRFGCWNIANAARDEIHNPLASRIGLIIERINLNPVDVLVLLEANRPSQGRSFTSIAAEIESATGLRYIGVKYLNSTSNAFAYSNPKSFATCRTNLQDRQKSSKGTSV